MKQLPNNLQNFKLMLEQNNLGENSTNLKFMGDKMKQLPYRLKNFELDL